MLERRYCRPVIRTPLAAALVVAASILCACGGGDDDSGGLATKPPASLVAATAGAIRSAGAYHMDGVLTDENRDSTRIVVDVDQPRVHLRLGSSAGTVEIVLIGSDAYVRGDAVALKEQLGSRATALLADKWLKLPADRLGTDTADLVRDFSPEELAYCLPRDLGTLRNLGIKKLGGRDAVVVADRGDKPGTAPRQAVHRRHGPAAPAPDPADGARAAGGTGGSALRRRRLRTGLRVR